LKTGPVEKTRDLVNLQLPGVPVHPVPVAPRQIPFHAGFVYFELDQSNELWGQLQSSGGIARPWQVSSPAWRSSSGPFAADFRVHTHAGFRRPLQTVGRYGDAAEAWRRPPWL